MSAHTWRDFESLTAELAAAASEIAAMSDEQVRAVFERRRAQEIIANQAATLPAPDEAGLIDIGSMEGAWERARGVVTSTGRRAHAMAPGPYFMTEPPRSARVRP